jgi:hypothetical protein
VSMRVRSVRLTAEVVGVLLFPILAGNSQKEFAQSDWGRICGFTNDPFGAAFRKAKVTVKNQSGVVRQAPANESGSCVISKRPPGFYRMTARDAGVIGAGSKRGK